MIKKEHIYKNARDFLFRMLSKEFLVFLFFLAVSAAFWFTSTLNDTYEMEIEVPVKISDVPSYVVITDPFPDTVRVTLRDKGFTLLQYMMGEDPAPLRLSFNLYTDRNGKGSITASEIQKILKARYNETTSITAVKADHWDFLYCYGARKRVPVRFDGDITAAQDYYITRCLLTPDSVEILAASGSLDTIRCVYTEPIQLMKVSATKSLIVSLRNMRGVKVEPSEVKLGVVVDQLTEVTVNVPVTTINVPAGTSLKTFPARVDIRVAVGVKSVSVVKAESFTVVADYNDLAEASGNKIPLRIKTQPRGIVKATLQNNSADYLLETE